MSKASDSSRTVSTTTGSGNMEEMDMGDLDWSCFGGGWSQNLIKVGSRENRISTVLSRRFAGKDSSWRETRGQ